ncbi:MAG TPA: hypothetical protein VMJ72_00470 [Candidatus Paceibacterota bacterium]|nr:hypothetical protein [Candidatus Paceibacterota bacterium]
MKRLLIFLTSASVVFIAGSGFAHADTLGQTTTFNVNPSFDAAGARTMSATLRSVVGHAYFYVDDRTWASLTPYEQTVYQSQLDALAGQFDSVIWPKATTFWGLPNTPGVDNDPRITVLLEGLTQGSGGYFDSINGYPKSQAPESNAREMVVVSADSVIPDTAKSFLAHEFQHLISFNQKELIQGVSDDIWLNEARSEYDITVAGYDTPFEGSTLQRRTLSFERSPNDPLTEWLDTSTDYGIASLFVHYLATRFGPTILQSTIHSRDAGTAAIQDWLTANAAGTKFGTTFADWMASVADDTALQSEIPRAQITGTSSLLTWSAALKEWQPEWLSIQVPYALTDDLSLAITGMSGSNPWFASVLADYGTSQRVLSWDVSRSPVLTVPASYDGSTLRGAILALSQGSIVAADGRQLATQQVMVTGTIGDLQVAAVPTPAPTPIQTPVPASSVPVNGDLIRRAGESDVYVVWGPYRRYLGPGILGLYGFQNRPVTTVPDDLFFGYLTTNYIRAVDQQKVYAVWPDGTKHWLDITPAQWDASHRDWNAIFIVNDAEVNAYVTGPAITH